MEKRHDLQESVQSTRGASILPFASYLYKEQILPKCTWQVQLEGVDTRSHRSMCFKVYHFLGWIQSSSRYFPGINEHLQVSAKYLCLSARNTFIPDSQLLNLLMNRLSISFLKIRKDLVPTCILCSHSDAMFMRARNLSCIPKTPRHQHFSPSAR